MGFGNVRDSILSRLADRLSPLVATKLLDRFRTAINEYIEDRILLELRNRSGQFVADALKTDDHNLTRFVDSVADRVFKTKQEHFEEQIRNLSANPFLASRLYIPNDIVAGAVDGPYMEASNALAKDFLHPRYAEFCKLYNYPIVFHRKLWEWAFIYHKLQNAGVLVSGNRGLGFGVGREKLPSLFGSMGVQITATDTPAEAVWSGWQDSNQHSVDRDQLFYPDILERTLFDEVVRFEPIDMNRLPDHLREYDFCRSSCAFEHLGSLRHGIDFVVASVEHTLKIGGIACHTTELNLTSDENTIETGPFVLYRKKDLLELCQLLEERGHSVAPIRIEPGHLPADYLVDVPPYRSDPHLKVEVGQYVSTSVGIVVRRGR